MTNLKQLQDKVEREFDKFSRENSNMEDTYGCDIESAKSFISSKLKEAYNAGVAQGQLDECKALLEKSKLLQINQKES